MTAYSGVASQTGGRRKIVKTRADRYRTISHDNSDFVISKEFTIAWTGTPVNEIGTSTDYEDLTTYFHVDMEYRDNEQYCWFVGFNATTRNLVDLLRFDLSGETIVGPVTYTYDITPIAAALSVPYNSAGSRNSVRLRKDVNNEFIVILVAAHDNTALTQPIMLMIEAATGTLLDSTAAPLYWSPDTTGDYGIPYDGNIMVFEVKRFDGSNKISVLNFFSEYAFISGNRYRETWFQWNFDTITDTWDAYQSNPDVTHTTDLLDVQPAIFNGHAMRYSNTTTYKQFIRGRSASGYQNSELLTFEFDDLLLSNITRQKTLIYNMTTNTYVVMFAQGNHYLDYLNPDRLGLWLYHSEGTNPGQRNIYYLELQSGSTTHLEDILGVVKDAVTATNSVDVFLNSSVLAGAYGNSDYYIDTLNGTITTTQSDYYVGKATNGSLVLRLGTRSGNVLPSDDAVYNLGSSTFRWDTVYAQTGTIQTSDATLKKNILDIDGAVAGDIIANLPIKIYQTKKGSRFHAGVLAQDVIALLKGYNYELGAFTEDKDSGLCGVRWDEITALLIAAFKEETHKRSRDRKRLYNLGKYVTELTKKVEELENLKAQLNADPKIKETLSIRSGVRSRKRKSRERKAAEDDLSELANDILVSPRGNKIKLPKT